MTPRDYKHITSKKPAKKALLDWKSFGFGLGTGLVLTVAVYLTEDLPSLSAFIIEQVHMTDEAPEQEVPVARETLPEPTFDFYKILPNMEVNVSEYETGDETPIVETDTDLPTAYILQVGSFKKFEAADEVKAKLALLGVNADIQRVVINGQDVYHRVRVGPYKNNTNLEEVQQRLISNNLDFKVLKLTVEDL